MRRVVQALLFDKVAFEGFEKNAEAIITSGIIVFFAGVLAGIGTVFAPVETPHILHSMVIMLLVEMLAFFTWFGWAGLAYLIGTKVLRGGGAFKEILRNLGFAYLPALLAFLLVTPIGLQIMAVLLIWMIGIGMMAVSSAEKFGVVRGLVTTALCWLVGVVIIRIVLIATWLIP